jgi:hypothetical protein
VTLHQLLVISFEIAVARLMEPNQNRHNFAQAQAANPSSSLQPVAQQLAFPLRFKGLTKVIDAAKEFF